MDMAARILDKMGQSPFSVEDLAFDLKRKPYEVRLLVNALLRDGSIVKLDTDREDGPFYAPASYIEPADRLDNSDLVLGREIRSADLGGRCVGIVTLCNRMFASAIFFVSL